MGGILAFAPFDFVDLFFYFEGFEVIELGFMGLKFRVEFILAGLFLRIMSVAGRKKGQRRTNSLVAFK